MGKSGTKEAGTTYSVAGIGLMDATKITFRMESMYITAASTSTQARTYSIQAATDLFGVSAAQTLSVTNA